jgi:predicted HTH domain antitoxin
MTLTISIPEEIEQALRSASKTDLEQSAKEDLAAAWFSSGKLSSRQVAQFLGISLFEAFDFLKRRNASLPMTAEEVEADAELLRTLPRS